MDISNGVLDSKECDTEMNRISSKAYKVDEEVEVYNADQTSKPNSSVKKYIVYKTSGEKVTAFEFYVYNGYSEKYDGSKWTVDKTHSNDFYTDSGN